ncbi:MAG: hypothetical protein HC817_12865 [Saprospiraceae bacterium]|nr:hypothetical protein [Saprospiraceae bacterium]
MLEKKHYVVGDLTVTWEPQKCAHSAVCFNELPEVFDPRRRPWITLEKADTERIIAQIKRCPSGALSFSLKNEQEVAVSEAQMTTQIDIIPNGPALIHGDLILKNAAGETLTKTGTTALCRCGASKNKPFCDGSHNKIAFEG